MRGEGTKEFIHFDARWQKSQTRPIESRIHLIRGNKVMLDADLAELYGVDTKNLNKAFQRNRERFPDDFMYQLTRQEFASLRFQIGTSKSRGGRRHYKSKGCAFDRAAADRSEENLSRLPAQVFDHGFGSGMDLQFFVDALGVSPHSSLADAQLRGNLFVEQALHEQVKDLLFAVG